MKTYVAVGSSTSRDYQFLLPLTCLFWREVIGHEPVAFLVGDWNSRRGVVARNALRQFVIEYSEVGSLDGYQEATFAQNVRHHAAALESIAADDWVAMADADLWPLRKDFYEQHVAVGEAIRAVCLYSNGDHFFGKKDVLSKFDAGSGFQSIPTCHVAMRAGDWREIYQLVPGDVVESTRRTLERMKPWLSRCSDQGLAVWCCDQWYVTERLCRQPWFPDFAIPRPTPPRGRTLRSDHVLLVERYGHPPIDRLDRSLLPQWAPAFDPARWTDAHVFKDPASEQHWKLLLKVIDAVLPKYSEWARKYHAEYAEASA